MVCRAVLVCKLSTPSAGASDLWLSMRRQTTNYLLTPRDVNLPAPTSHKQTQIVGLRPPMHVKKFPASKHICESTDNLAAFVASVCTTW